VKSRELADQLSDLFSRSTHGQLRVVPVTLEFSAGAHRDSHHKDRYRLGSRPGRMAYWLSGGNSIMPPMVTEGSLRPGKHRIAHNADEVSGPRGLAHIGYRRSKFVRWPPRSRISPASTERSNTMKHRIAQRMKARRARQGFVRALQTASPSMRQELIAMATRDSLLR
jgi:hypothetical protein